MSIGVLKYNAGNIFSVECALSRLNADVIVSDDFNTLDKCDKIIFPGVGEAAAAMQYIRNNNIDTWLTNLTKPVLGICIGQQLMCEYSEEGDVECLGIFNQTVKRFNSDKYKIPHTGWDTIKSIATNSFITPEFDNEYVYYVHSYYVPICEHTIASTDYILPFSAAMQRNNFFATQFHPEKSGKIGEAILKQFLLI